MSDENFNKALKLHDVGLMGKISKSDLHNHSILGSRIEKMEKWLGKKIVRPPEKIQNFVDFEKYLDLALDEVMKKKGFFGNAIKSSFLQAKSDGILVLQMSVDSRFYKIINSFGKGITEIVKSIQQRISPEILFIPQLGLDRKHNLKQLLYEAESLLETNYFQSIDLYGDELYGNIKDFVPLYRKAKNMGMVLTAHVGEYGSADSVRTAVELLDLKQVQHGITSSESKEVMRWLSDNKIVLNICPSSNVFLCRAESIKKHPIRILYDHGITVTINTDDLMVFNQSVSEEYLSLYREGVFGEEALDEIRLNGLNAFKNR